MATKKISPTQRSLARLREEGWLVEIVEHWNPWSRTRKDLWGWCDLLCLRGEEILAVQVTASGVSSRIKKIQESETISWVRKANIRVHVHGWRKSAKTGKYVLRIEDIS